MVARWTVGQLALRLAWRDLLGARLRALLLALLIGLPVMGMVAVDVGIRNFFPGPQELISIRLGDQAQAVIGPVDLTMQMAQDAEGGAGNGSSREPEVTTNTVAAADAQLRALIPAEDRLIRVSSLESDRWLRVGDLVSSVKVLEAPFSDPVIADLMSGLTGRTPQQPGEVVITSSLAHLLDLQLGDTFTLPRRALPESAPIPDRELTVVGIATWGDLGPALLAAEHDLYPAAWAAAANPADTVWYVAGPTPITWTHVLAINDHGGTVFSRQVVTHPPAEADMPLFTCDEPDGSCGGVSGPSTWSPLVLIALVAVFVALTVLQAGLLAGPALAMDAQRRERQLALITSMGGELRHLRMVVLAKALLIGIVASVIGAAAGIVAGAVWVRQEQESGMIMSTGLAVRPADVAGLIGAGVLAVLLAALIPARHASRADPIEVLTDRRVPRTLRSWVSWAGLPVFVTGAVLAVWAAARGLVVPLLIGLSVAELGLALAASGLIGVVARWGRFGPVSLRIAARGAARQWGRTAPAVAAVMAAVAAGTTGVLFLAAENRYAQWFNTPQAALNTVLVDWLCEPESGPNCQTQVDWPKVVDVIRREVPVDALVERRGLQNQQKVALNVEAEPAPVRRCGEFEAPLPGPAVDPGPAQVPECSALTGRRLMPFTPPALVDDGSTVALYTGVDDPGIRSALAAGKVVVYDPNLIWPDGMVHLRTWTTDLAKDERTVVVPGYVPTTRVSLQSLVFPESRLADLQATSMITGVLAHATREPTLDEEELIIAGIDPWVKGMNFSITRGSVTSETMLPVWLLILPALIALLGTFAAVGLTAADTRADLSTLAAVGASPRVRRRLIGAQSGLVAGLGTALGLVGGLLATLVLIRYLRQQGFGAIGEGPPGFWETLVGVDNGWRLELPWGPLTLLVVGIPALAVLLALLVTRSDLSVARRFDQ